MEIVAVVDAGLGNSSYVVGLGDGGALVVDPARDAAPYLAIAEERGWRIRFAAETHLHADFVSGSRELAARGTQTLTAAGAAVGFPATLLGHGDEADVGGLVLRALATPGHTPEHLSYLVCDGGSPQAVFTGGALLPGGVARPDLIAPERTLELARSAHRSIRDQLLALPDDLPVYPTHGAGSFCSAGSGGERTTTIGAERAANPLLDEPDEDAFAARLLSGLGSYPPYFLELREVNRAGPRVYGDTPPLPLLDVPAAERLVTDGAECVDVRGIEAFAAGHIPGSLSNPLRDGFATWLGWLVERDRPIVVVADDATDRRRLVWACLNIGYERLVGEVGGGVGAWSAAGRPLARIRLVGPGEADPRRRVVDVRQASEWAQGHLSGAAHLELGELQRRAGELGPEPLLTHCAHGERAMTAASLLARAGHTDVAALAGGPEDLAAATGRWMEPQ